MSPAVHVAWPTVTPPSPPTSIDIRTTADADVGHARGGYTEVYNNNPAFHTRTGTTTSYVGVRFQDVLIPKDATITTATVTTYQHENSSDYNTPADDTTVGIEAADDPGIMNNSDFETRQANLAATTFTWAQDTEGYMNNDAMQPITLTAALQEIVNRAGWASGNSIMVWFYHAGSGTKANGFRPHLDQSASVTPRLEVAFTV